MPNAPQPAKPAKSVGKKLYLGVLAVILLTTALLAGYSLGLQQSKQSSDTGYQAGYDAAHQQLISAGLLQTDQTMTTISGNVSSVEDGKLTIDVPQVVSDPLAEQAPLQRLVEVGADTKILRLEAKSAKEMAAEEAGFDAAQQKFREAVAAGKEATPPLPPSAQKQTEIKASDIAVGDRVTVTAADDILRDPTIAAVQITVQSSASAPAATVPPSEGVAPPPAGQ